MHSVLAHRFHPPRIEAHIHLSSARYRGWGVQVPMDKAIHTQAQFIMPGIHPFVVETWPREVAQPGGFASEFVVLERLHGIENPQEVALCRGTIGVHRMAGIMIPGD